MVTVGVDHIVVFEVVRHGLVKLLPSHGFEVAATG
jgi:hypothetical protein